MHLMEVLWNFDGEITESLWKFHGEILDWNMEKPWNICGKTDMEKLWKTNTLENCRLGKTKNALQWSSTRTKRKD